MSKSTITKFTVGMIMYLIDLGLFWSMVITGAAGLLGKMSFKVSILFLVLFVLMTIALVVREFRNAIDEKELMGGIDVGCDHSKDRKDNNYDYHKLVSDDRDPNSKEYYAELYRKYLSEHAEKQQDNTK